MPELDPANYDDVLTELGSADAGKMAEGSVDADVRVSPDLREVEDIGRPGEGWSGRRKRRIRPPERFGEWTE